VSHRLALLAWLAALPPPAQAALPAAQVVPAAAQADPTTALAPVGPATARRAAAVTLELPPGEDEAAMRGLLALEPGQAVTARALRRTAQRLFQTGRCRNVVIREAPAAAPAPAADQGPGPGDGGGPWVSLTVTCQPQRLLGTVTVALQGPSPLDGPAVRVAASLEAGEPVDEVDLSTARDRVRAALRRRGHLSAEVDATLSGERPATVALSVRAGAPTRVSALRLPGAGALASTLLPRLRLRVGAVLDEEALAEDVRTVRTSLHAAGFRRARVASPVVRPVAGAAEVEIPVEPGPRVAIEIRGSVAFAPADLLGRLGLDDEQPLDLPAIDAAVDRLRAFYRRHGYASARLEAEERVAGAGLVVVFHVEEGRLERLGRLQVTGAETRGGEVVQARLRELLAEEATPEGASPAAERARALQASILGAPALREPPPALPAGAVLDEVALERAADQVVEEYRNDGWLEAAMLGWSAEHDAARGTVDVTVRLREGARSTVESIGFEGNEAVPLAELVKEVRLAPGEPLVYERIEATRVALLQLYLRRSHLYARVEARESLDPGRHTAALRFVVQEGPRVRIGRILVSGNVRTREAVVRRSLEVEEGSLHDPEAMARSQAALLRLGVFRSVGLRLQDPEVPEQVKDLVVEVAERPWQYVAPGAGFSIANGPRLFLEYERPNLLGRALELTARAKVNYPLSEFRPDLKDVSPKNTFEGRADVGLRAPRLDPLPLPVAGRANLIAERLRRSAYDLARASGILGADFAVTSAISLSLQYEVEVDRITKPADQAAVLTQADLERLRFDNGTTTLHSVRPSATLDFRDNAAHPHRGWFVTGSAELARSIGGPGGRLLFFPGSEFFTSLLKLQGTASAYLPMGDATVLALSVRGGRIVPLSSRSRTIVPKRFFLGGAATLRGFAEEEMVPQDLREGLGDESQHCASSITGVGCTAVGRDLAGGKAPVSSGGELFLLMKAELRLALRGSVEVGLFVDAGNLWLDPRAYRLLDVRPSAGVGLRFVTPVGPAALDLGFNLQPDRRINERTFAPHFTIGLF